MLFDTQISIILFSMYASTTAPENPLLNLTPEVKRFFPNHRMIKTWTMNIQKFLGNLRMGFPSEKKNIKTKKLVILICMYKK